MVRIENPKQGKPVFVHENQAGTMIAQGRAVATVQVNGTARTIRLVDPIERLRATERGYDGIDKTFYRLSETAAITLIQPRKLLAEGGPSREWSGRASVELKRKKIHVPRRRRA